MRSSRDPRRLGAFFKGIRARTQCANGIAIAKGGNRRVLFFLWLFAQAHNQLDSQHTRIPLPLCSLPKPAYESSNHHLLDLSLVPLGVLLGRGMRAGVE